MPPVNWLAGWVQLWFFMAITKTVLISSAPAFNRPNTKTRANTPSVPRRLTFVIHSSGGDKIAANADLVSGGPVVCLSALRSPISWIAALFCRQMNGILLFDERLIRAVNNPLLFASFAQSIDNHS